MKLSCPAFADGDVIPSTFTCDGENHSPQLEISDKPAGTVSYALIVDDPDAPVGIFTHWVVWNIDKNVSMLEENQLPSGGIQGTNDFGKARYDGPCPPHFQLHRYRFKLYALDTMLSLPPGASAAGLMAAMQGHILDNVELVGKYKRA